jgi:hypothetical protein
MFSYNESYGKQILLSSDMNSGPDGVSRLTQNRKKNVTATGFKLFFHDYFRYRWCHEKKQGA